MYITLDFYNNASENYFEFPQGLNIGDAIYVHPVPGTGIQSSQNQGIQQLLCIGSLSDINQVSGEMQIELLYDFEDNNSELYFLMSGEDLAIDLQEQPQNYFYYALPMQSVNKSSVKGYYSKAIWRNNDKKNKSELFATYIGAVESSK
tara:strand:- start:1798 stop:2241 length:444 start_codon:yes stop_codon:yes gene_type:complete